MNPGQLPRGSARHYRSNQDLLLEDGCLEPKIAEENAEVWRLAYRWCRAVQERRRKSRHLGGHCDEHSVSGRRDVSATNRYLRRTHIRDFSTAATGGCVDLRAAVIHRITHLVGRGREERATQQRRKGGDDGDGNHSGADRSHDALCQSRTYATTAQADSGDFRKGNRIVVIAGGDFHVTPPDFSRSRLGSADYPSLAEHYLGDQELYLVRQ